MLVDHLPEPAGVRIVGYAGEHQGRRPVGERTVDDVGVTGDPTHVGGAPVDVPVLVVEDVAVGRCRVHHVAAGRVKHALGFAGGAGGIEDEQRVFGVHGLAGADRRSEVHAVLGDEVPAFRCHWEIILQVGHEHEDGVNVRTAFQRLIHIVLERDFLAAAHAEVGGDDHPAVAVEDAIFQSFR